LRRSSRLRALAALLAVLLGCNADQYSKARFRDLGDIVRGHVMAGVGVDAHVEVTTFVGLGFGAYHADAWGWGDRYFGHWKESVYDFGVVWMNGHGERTEGVPRVSGSHDFRFWSAFDARHGPVYTTNALRRADWLTLRATAFLFVGVDVELRLGEVLDFVAGLFGADPSQDDGEWPPPVEPAEPAAEDKPATAP
jgi:hypothetical protein